MVNSREIHLKSRPVGMPTVDNFELVTVSVPGASGVPEITPVAGFTLSPGGSPVTDHEYGVTPPVAASVWV